MSAHDTRLMDLFNGQPWPSAPNRRHAPRPRPAIPVRMLNVLCGRGEFYIFWLVVLFVQIDVVDLQLIWDWPVEVCPDDAMSTDSAKLPVDLQRQAQVALAAYVLGASWPHGDTPTMHDGRMSPDMAIVIDRQRAVRDEGEGAFHCCYFAHVHTILYNYGNGREKPNGTMRRASCDPVLVDGRRIDLVVT